MKLPFHLKFKLRFSWNTLLYGIFAILLGLFIWTGTFLYREVFQTLAHPESALKTKAPSSSNVLNRDDVKTVLQLIDQKENPAEKKDWLSSPNIFLRGRSSAAADIPPAKPPVAPTSTPATTLQ